jgi:outer membrane protein assembly factor BamD (BamD/ComL family)
LDEYPNFLTLESEYTLYQGLTLMELKRYDEAIEKLKQLQNNNITSIIQSTNNWYLGLCYLKAGKNKQAIAQLEKITNEKVIFYKDAKELLEKLKK